MVGETGEATARFLRSVAAGEVDARDSLARAAAVGLKRLQTPPHAAAAAARPRVPAAGAPRRLLISLLMTAMLTLVGCALSAMSATACQCGCRQQVCCPWCVYAACPVPGRWVVHQQATLDNPPKGVL